MILVRSILVATLVTCSTVSSVLAQTEAEQAKFSELFSRMSDASEGVAVEGSTIVAEDGLLLQNGDACAFSKLVNADEVCTVSAILFPSQDIAIDSIYYAAPENIGHVNMDDWAEDTRSQIDEIWDGYVEGTKAQSERIGYEVVPLKWVQYPTLNKASKVMTYGILLDFGGEETINLTVVKFSRSGYVVMQLVTDTEMLDAYSATFDG